MEPLPPPPRNPKHYAYYAKRFTAPSFFLSFRGIDELLIEPCCAVKYYPEMETCENEIFMEEDENREDDEARCQSQNAFTFTFNFP